MPLQCSLCTIVKIKLLGTDQRSKLGSVDLFFFFIIVVGKYLSGLSLSKEFFLSQIYFILLHQLNTNMRENNKRDICGEFSKY